MDNADDGADNEADQLIYQAFPNDSGLNKLQAMIELSKQIYTELAVKNIIAELTDELVQTYIGDKIDPHAFTSLKEELKPDPQAPTTLKEELKPDPHTPKSMEEELAPYNSTSLGVELDSKSQLNTPTSQQLEYILIHPKADDNSKTATSESCEPNTSDLLEQTDAKPEQIIKEEVEHIFKHTFDSVAQKIDGNLWTDFQQSGNNSGDSFQDLEVRNAPT